jgi:AraC-like DNA-binding protein
MLEIYNDLRNSGGYIYGEKIPELIHITKNNEPNLTTSDALRIITFENKIEEYFYIDFFRYKSETNKFFIVPPKHFLFLPEKLIDCTTCLFIPMELLSFDEQLFIYRLMFSESKYICRCQSIYNLENINLNEKYPLKNILKPYLMYRQLTQREKQRKCEQAKQLTDIIKQFTITHTLLPKHILEKLPFSEATLQRLYSSVFNCPTQKIIHYFMTIKIIYKLLHYRDASIWKIADELKFENESFFFRLTKKMTQRTPTEIRDNYPLI